MDDLTTALYWMKEIIHPCSNQYGNLRKDYITEAEAVLRRLKNPHAKNLLERTIKGVQKYNLS